MNYAKNTNVITRNSGIKMPPEYSIYSKKCGTLKPCSSAMALTIKFGPLPIYVFAPINTAI